MFYYIHTDLSDFKLYFSKPNFGYCEFIEYWVDFTADDWAFMPLLF